MRLVLFLLLIVECWSDMRVLIDQHGGYNITSNNQIWLRSSFAFVGKTTAQGIDPHLGS